jgi:tetratricopeptide (TPR) repeat protein
MSGFADLSHLRGLANQLANEAESGRIPLVIASTGAGRWTLADILVRETLQARAIDVRLPPFDAHDAAVHGLFQVAASLGPSALETARDAHTSMSARAEALATRVRDSKRVLIVHVPESWWVMPVPPNAGRKQREDRGRDLLKGLIANAPAIVLLHDCSRELFRDLGRAVVLEHLLPPPRLDPTVLDDEERWGPYASAFRQVVTTPGSERLSPIQLRLLVGLSALGEDPSEHVAALGGSSRLVPLAERLGEILSLPERKELGDVVRRFLRARFPLPRATALRVSRCPAEHVPLLTDCISYEQDGGLRVADTVRVRLRGRAGTVAYPEAHQMLAAHHRELDGAAAPPAERSKVVNWLERAYHLGRSGAAGTDEWEEMALAPEQLLDRAWSLSVEHRNFHGGAQLYRRYLRDYGEDAYAFHYLAFNLDRAGAERDDVERSYRRAVELDPTNPWWNSRLVTFLIRDLRYQAADEEWRKCLERIDPQEARIERDPWLGRHVHRWVAQEWLAHGEAERAFAAFRLIPREVTRDDPVLRELRQRLEDARESIQLGESVYPATVPIHERWRKPRILADRKDDQPLQKWTPGRILDANSDMLTFVVALPAEKRVFKQQVSQQEWRKWGGSSPRPDRFFEMGFYGKDAEIIEVRELPDVADDIQLTLTFEDDEELAPLSAVGT